MDLTTQTPVDVSVPAADSADNLNWGDVIGTKLDTHLGDSLYARVLELYDNFQGERLCYPTLANGVSVVSANADWTYGAYATIIPASTIGTPFHITIVSIEACDRDAVFQLELYQGAGDTIISAVRFAVNGGFFGNQVYAVGSGEVSADARVRARLASSNGAAQIATIVTSIVYIAY